MKRLALVIQLLSLPLAVACSEAAPSSNGSAVAGTGGASESGIGPTDNAVDSSNPAASGGIGGATGAAGQESGAGGGATPDGGVAGNAAGNAAKGGSSGAGSGGSSSTSARVRAGCESVEHDGHVYALCRDQKLAFPAARKDCEAMQMQLIRLDSAQESDWIYATFYSKPAAPGGDGSQMWVGATDTAVEGEWRWLIGGDVFWRGKADGMAVGDLYAHWGRAHAIGAQDQPNDSHSVEGEDCMVIRGPSENEGGKWTDISCAEENQPPAPDTRIGWYTCESQ